MPTHAVPHSHIVKHSDLLNQLILDRHTMAQLGQVEALWMYPKVHRVLGFISKSGWLGAQKAAFNLDQLHTLGAQSILVSSAPMATDIEKVRELESLVQCAVWTDDGNQIGKIVDYLFDYKTGAIQAYLFVSNGWGRVTGSVYELPPSQILNLGHRRILIAESAIQSCQIYRAGLQEKLTQATAVLKAEKTHVTAELRSLLHQAQTASTLAKDRAQALAEQAKATALSLNEHWLDTTQTLTDELRDRAVDRPTDVEWDDDWPPTPLTPPTPTDDIWDDEWTAAPSSSPAVPTAAPTAAPPAAPDPADEPWI